MDTAERRSATHIAGLVLVAAGCVLFLALGFGRITAPFGDSDEGINGAVWSLSARSLRDPRDRRLEAGRAPHRRHRVRHPPAGDRRRHRRDPGLGGARSWASRAPAWLATLAALVLLYRLGRRARFSPARRRRLGRARRADPHGARLRTDARHPDRGVPVRRARDHVLVPRLAHGGPGDLAAAGLDRAGRPVRRALRLAGGGAHGAVRPHAGGSPPSATDPVPSVPRFPIWSAARVGVALSLSWSWWVYGSFYTLFDKFGGRSGRILGRRPRRHGVVPAAVAGQPARPLVRRLSSGASSPYAIASCVLWPRWPWPRSGSTR